MGITFIILGILLIIGAEFFWKEITWEKIVLISIGLLMLIYVILVFTMRAVSADMNIDINTNSAVLMLFIILGMYILLVLGTKFFWKKITWEKSILISIGFLMLISVIFIFTLSMINMDRFSQIISLVVGIYILLVIGIKLFWKKITWEKSVLISIGFLILISVIFILTMRIIHKNEPYQGLIYFFYALGINISYITIGFSFLLLRWIIRYIKSNR